METSTTPKHRKKLITFLASYEWGGWLKGLCNHTGLSQAAAIDQGLRLYAKQVGFDEKPPKR